MGVDPDMAAMSKAGEAIKPVLKSLGVQPTKIQTSSIASTAVISWLTNRAHEWSKDRSIAGVGSPDAYTVGFALAILPKIADANFDFDKPLKDWSRDEMSRLLALGSDLIDDQRATAMEAPIDLPV